MSRLATLLVTAAAFFSLSGAAASQEGYMWIHGADRLGHACGGVEIGTKGPGSSGVTTDDGKVRLALTPGTKPGDHVPIQILSRGWILISPKDGYVTVPSASGFAQVILTKPANRSQPETGQGLVNDLRVCQSINEALARIITGPRPSSLEEAARLVGEPYNLTASQVLKAARSAMLIEAAQSNGIDALDGDRLPYHKHALIIGISHYKTHERGLTDLDYAASDARAIRDFLKKKEGGGYTDSDIVCLEDEQATLEAVRAGLNRLRREAGSSDLVFIYISGHASPDPYAPQNPPYFIMHDTRVAEMARTALPMVELEDLLTRGLRANRVVAFLDAEHSAGVSGEPGIVRVIQEPARESLFTSRLFRETGRAVITSSDVNEVSFEGERWGGGHGVFTFALLEGLAGGADANGDHLITAGELFAYVRNRVRRETSFRQNPRWILGINADLPLAYVEGR